MPRYISVEASAIAATAEIKSHEDIPEVLAAALKCFTNSASGDTPNSLYVVDTLKSGPHGDIVIANLNRDENKLPVVVFRNVLPDTLSDIWKLYPNARPSNKGVFYVSLTQ